MRKKKETYWNKPTKTIHFLSLIAETVNNERKYNQRAESSITKFDTIFMTRYSPKHEDWDSQSLVAYAFKNSIINMPIYLHVSRYLLIYDIT